MKILNTILTIGCLGGLVSCYPIAGQNPATATAVKKKAASVKTPTKKAVKTATKKKVSKTTKTAKKKVRSTSSKVKTTPKKITKPVVKKVTPPKPAAPKVVKNASKVPGKAGFVFNPYTNNQVDVRGIPSGTKVRDPHDSNPTHVFRVP